MTELSVVYEEVNPINAAYTELRRNNSTSDDSSMDTYNNRAYKVPRPLTKENLATEPQEGYEIMRSVSHQKL